MFQDLGSKPHQTQVKELLSLIQAEVAKQMSASILPSMSQFSIFWKISSIYLKQLFSWFQEFQSLEKQFACLVFRSHNVRSLNYVMELNLRF